MINKDALADTGDLLWDFVGAADTELAGVNRGLVQIKVDLGNVGTKNVLIDTGAELSCLSVQVYQDLKEANQILAELAVTGLKAYGALGRRHERIERQVLFKVAVPGGGHIAVKGVVLKTVCFDLIFGADWLREIGAVINLQGGKLRGRGRDIVTGAAMPVQWDLMNRCAEVEGRISYLYGEHDEEDKEETADKGSVIHEEDGENRGEGIKQATSEGKLEGDFDNILEGIVENLKTTRAGERRAFREMMLKNREVFSESPGCFRNYVHTIETIAHKPHKQKPYPIPYALRDKVWEALRQMEEGGIIQRRASPYCNPITVVCKRDGQVRICLDARRLNTVVVDAQERPMLMSEALQRFEGKPIISTVDMTKGYYQIRLSDESSKLTAFVADGRQYCWVRLPFGLKISGQTFIKQLDLALGEEFRENVTVYVDDIIVASESFREHVIHLDSLFTRLREHGLTINIKKTAFVRDEVEFLGHLVSARGIKPLPARVKTIRDMPAPRNLKQLRHFIGFITFYSKFVFRFAELLNPMYQLLKKGVKWKWDAEMDAAFERAKEAFTRCVILRHPLPQQPYVIRCDASLVGISAILSQVDPDGEERVVALCNRGLKTAELAYTITELELLAIVYGTQKFRTYIYGRPTVLYTDHQALTFLRMCDHLSARLKRWAIAIDEYNLQIIHVKGSQNIAADFLSRYISGEAGEGMTPREREVVIAKLKFRNSSGSNQFCRVIREAQGRDEFCELVRSRIRRVTEEGASEDFQETNGLLFRRDPKVRNEWVLYIPKDAQRRVMHLVHDEGGHPGVYKTTEMLKSLVYWRGLSRDVKRYVKTCDLCQKCKFPNLTYQAQYQSIIPEMTGDLVMVDLYGPLVKSRGGLAYIFIMVDVVSKFAKLYGMKRATAKACVAKMRQYCREEGKPRVVLSDHGTQFFCDLWRRTLWEEGIKTIYSSIRHPESNVSERYLRNVGTILRTLCHQKHQSWAIYLRQVEDHLNYHVNMATGEIPAELHYGRRMILPLERIVKYPEAKRELDVERAIERARERMRRRAEQRLRQQKPRPIQFDVGSLVLVKALRQSDAEKKISGKLSMVYKGPYVIRKRMGEGVYKVQLMEGNAEVKVFNVTNLIPYYQREEM